MLLFVVIVVTNAKFFALWICQLLLQIEEKNGVARMLLPCFIRLTSYREEPQEEEPKKEQKEEEVAGEEEKNPTKGLQEEDKGEDDLHEDKPHDKTGLEISIKRDRVEEEYSKRSLFAGHVER